MDEREPRKASSSFGSRDRPAFHLDEIIPARYVSFRVLRNLIHCIARTGPLRYAEIVDRPLDPVRRVLVRNNGEFMGRSSRYHHLNALKILGLVAQHTDGYSLEPAAEAIAHSHCADDAEPLSLETRRALQSVVRSCDFVRRNFLILFVGDRQCDPWKSGAPVALQPIPGQRTYDLTCPNWPGRVQLSRKQTLGVIWGLRHWCQSLRLVDEMFIRPQADVGPERANIIFPVAPDRDENITLALFDAALRRHLSSAEPFYADTVAISIPLLFYRLCPAERISLPVAKSLLRAWLARNRAYATVEACSFGILRAGRFRRGSSRAVWRKQQDGFLEIGGSVYSRLLVSRAVWDHEREDSDASREPDCQRDLG